MFDILKSPGPDGQLNYSPAKLVVAAVIVAFLIFLIYFVVEYYRASKACKDGTVDAGDISATTCGKRGWIENMVMKSAKTCGDKTTKSTDPNADPKIYGPTTYAACPSS